MPTLANIAIPTSGSDKHIALTTGKVLMVAGPNGAGKSGLLYYIYKTVGGRADYYPGHRQVNFNNGWETLGQDMNQLRANMYANYDVFNRYKSAWSEDQFKSVVRKVQHADAAYNANIVYAVKSEKTLTSIDLETNDGPVETLNLVFSAARMAVRFQATAGGLRATRDGLAYEIDQLSDGERAALLVVGAIITQESYTVIVIDEPERHLHPSISSSLIGAAIRARDDIAYCFASHDVSLISGLNPDTIVHIKNSQVTSIRPESRSYNLDIIDGVNYLDDSLKRDLLGTRQTILFVEGETSSLDFPIYNSIFTEYKVIPKGGADKVIEATKALRDNENLHWTNAIGLIDRDGRDLDELEKLSINGVHAINSPTIENLVFSKKVIEAVCAVSYELEGGISPEGRTLLLETNLLLEIRKALPDIISRIATWRINRVILASKTSVAKVRDGNLPEPVDAKAILESVKAEISSVFERDDVWEIIRDLPIKNTPIPSTICKIIGIDISRYRRMVSRQLETESAHGKIIRAAIVAGLPALSSEIKYT